MSRIGMRPVIIPKTVKVNVGKDVLGIEGPKGKLQFPLGARLSVTVDGNKVKVERSGNARADRAMHGLTRAMIANMVEGVEQGYVKELELVGVGYRAQVSGKKVTLQLGFSHQIEFPIPEGIIIESPKQTQLIIKGIDKQKVGQVAANLRAFFPPEPYKGKGVRYAGEQVRRKAGKAVAK
ncbi:MAG: 50S ribosomal protein L6 [Candidatus Omnitrophica bacterium]|nr:50S ribosomal protein L6 [Candidatus Omnitrophota bacterium]